MSCCQPYEKIMWGSVHNVHEGRVKYAHFRLATPTILVTLCTHAYGAQPLNLEIYKDKTTWYMLMPHPHSICAIELHVYV